LTERSERCPKSHPQGLGLMLSHGIGKKNYEDKEVCQEIGRKPHREGGALVSSSFGLAAGTSNFNKRFCGRERSAKDAQKITAFVGRYSAGVGSLERVEGEGLCDEGVPEEKLKGNAKGEGLGLQTHNPFSQEGKARGEKATADYAHQGGSGKRLENLFQEALSLPLGSNDDK